jgi:SpoIID/LytB domain protein
MRSRWTKQLVIVALAAAACVALRCAHRTVPPPMPATGLDRVKMTPVPSIAEERVRLELGHGHTTVRLAASSAIVLTDGARELRLPAGGYTLEAQHTRAARIRYHLFAKGFHAPERLAAEAFAQDWKAQGYSAEIITLGDRLRAASGRVLDNRLYWVSVMRADSQQQAEVMKQRLQQRKVWAWIRPELVVKGAALVTVRDSGGRTVGSVPCPLQIDADGPITLFDIDRGFHESQLVNATYGGSLSVEIGNDGRFSILEEVALEDYLAGVLPAEMPTAWPAAALEAQAIAARSDVLANRATKHPLDGFDFCTTEHCRAYAGVGLRVAATDAAVAATGGVVLADGGRIIPAVFSATCGGWTEDNDAVWSGPADSALRGVRDFVDGSYAASPIQTARWLSNPPRAHCQADARYFRWRRNYANAELSEIVNKRHTIGTILRIETGDRGVSGRLKWVRIIGDRGQVTVQKELPIRLAFGGLPSALFIVESTPGQGRPGTFTFIGGGRGHGVGMCQYGAQGMALQGANSATIVSHYFTGVDLLRVR